MLNALILRFGMLLRGVPYPTMQLYQFVSRFDGHKVSYQESSSSSSSADISDEPKEDTKSKSESESEPRRLVHYAFLDCLLERG